MKAADECDAPIVSIAGGEPLIHPDIVGIVKGLVDQGRYVYLCTNALLLDRYIDQMPKSPRLTFSIHLDGMKEHHDHICAEEGVYDKAIDAIKLAKQKGFRVTTNTTFFGGVTVEEAEEFLDHLKPLGVDGMTVASAFQYPDAPTQDQFFGRRRTQDFFKELLAKNQTAAGISAIPLFTSNFWKASAITIAPPGAIPAIRFWGGRSPVTCWMKGTRNRSRS